MFSAFKNAWATSLFVCTLVFSTTTPALTLPTGFNSELVAGNLGFPVVMDWALDGRIFLGTKDGRVQVVENGTVLADDFIDISAEVNDFHDRGMLGLAVHPNFPTTPYVYLWYTYDPPGLPGGEFGGPDGGGPRVSRLLRVTADPADTNKALPGSEVILLGSNSTLANIGHPDLDGWFRDIGGSCENPDGSPIADCIPSDSPTHTVGTLLFGHDGALYVSHGDGATFAEDTRLLKAQDLNSPAGKILRIDPITGQGLTDNPFYDGNPDSWISKVYQSGLKNPFRFTIDNQGRIWNGDVGTNEWEEINTGVAGANFGYPCYEGGNATNEILDEGLETSATCVALYAQEAATPGMVTASRYAYDHSAGGASVQAGSLLGGQNYPAEYQGTLFYLDYNRNWIKYLTLDQNGYGYPHDFASDVGGIDGGPVWSRQGPDDNIYYIVFRRYTNTFTAELRRIVYVGTGGNNPPVAVASVDTTSGDAPLTVHFDSQGSNDPDGDPIAYLWDFGDGNSSTLSNPQHTYTTSGVFNVTLNVTDDQSASDQAALTITATGGSLPDPVDPIGGYLNGVFPNNETGVIPATLSATGVFANMNTMEIAAGLMPYGVNSQLWSDRAEKSRWIALPNDGFHTNANEKISFSENAPWIFPEGTVVVKQFTVSDRKVETRFLVNGINGWYGFTYRWREDGTEADLLTNGQNETLDINGTVQEWSYPSRSECMECHTASSGRVLAMNTWQINRDLDGENQLAAMSRKGMFDTTLDSAAISSLLASVAIDAPATTAELRVRSYIDSNCAHCHNPENNVRANFDARFVTPLAQQNIVNGNVEDTLGISGAKVVVPGKPESSLLFIRAHSLENGVAMPPLAKNQLDQQALEQIRGWIASLDSTVPGELMANYRSAFSSGQPANNWRYLWNEHGPIGSSSSYSELLWDGSSQYDSDGQPSSPDSSEFGYGKLDALGGHTGMGTGDGAGLPRFAIAEYTIPLEGDWHIANSFIDPLSCSWSDGVDIQVYVNDTLKSQSNLEPAEYHSFDQPLGNLSAGDKVVIAAGPRLDSGCDGFFWDFSFSRLPSEPVTENFVGGYRSDFTPGQIPSGWNYQWNETGPLGNSANYSTLIWDGSGSFDSDASPSGSDNTAFGYGEFNAAGGHAGKGTGNGEAYPRYAIATYTATGFGTYGIANSFLELSSCEWTDGLDLQVFVNDQSSYQGYVVRGSRLIFDQDFGILNPGDKIDIAVGPGGSDGCDGFSWDFDITFEAEDQQESEIVAGFKRDFQGNAPASGWQYQWNPSSAIGQRAAYTDLLWDGSWLYDSDGLNGRPDLSEFGWGALNIDGGHPGDGTENGTSQDRFVITSYTVSQAGLYDLTNASISHQSCEFSNGGELQVWINDSQHFAQTYPKDGSLDFNQVLGQLNSGDIVTVAAGPSGHSGCDGFQWDFDLQVTHTSNNPPVFQMLGNQTSLVGDNINLQLVATDADGDTLTYSESGLPAGLFLNTESGLISGTLTTAGVYPVQLMAADPSGASSTLNLDWTVNTAQ